MKKKEIRIPNYTLKEELINSISHGVGALLSILALVMIIIKSSKSGALSIVCVTLFGTSIVLLYTMSCIYHALSKNIGAKKVFRVLDHCNVFLLVYGTIIPVCLVGIGGVYGWVFFAIVSLVTALGITLSAIDIDRFQVLEVICHLINGWSVLFFSKLLINNAGINCLILLILGGIMYSAGSILYSIGSNKKYFHSIFHFFCLFGTILHYLAIYLYII